MATSYSILTIAALQLTLGSLEAAAQSATNAGQSTTGAVSCPPECKDGPEWDCCFKGGGGHGGGIVTNKTWKGSDIKDFGGNPPTTAGTSAYESNSKLRTFQDGPMAPPPNIGKVF